MTDEQILATADACGMMNFSQGWNKKKFEFCLLAFAKQITKLEREACAGIVDPLPYEDISARMLENRAALIRARGQA